jgi:hypothetical protein
MNKQNLKKWMRTLKRATKKLKRLIEIVFIIGVFAAFFVNLSQINMSITSWYYQDPILVIQGQETMSQDNATDYIVNLSLVNRRDEPLTLDSVIFRIGDYASEGACPPTCYIVFNKFSHELKLLFLGTLNGTSFPIIKRYDSNESMGAVAVSIIGERGMLVAHEQIDINLLVRIYTPEELKGENLPHEYPTIWSLGGRIIVLFEDKSLQKRILLYPNENFNPHYFAEFEGKNKPATRVEDALDLPIWPSEIPFVWYNTSQKQQELCCISNGSDSHTLLSRK